MAEEIPDSVEYCLRDPDYQDAQEILLYDVRSCSSSELPHMSELEYLLYENSVEENIRVLLASKCETKGIVDMNIYIEGWPRFRFVQKGHYAEKVLAKAMDPDNQIPNDVQYIEFDTIFTRMCVERLSDDQQAAVLRYAFACRLKGLEMAFENALSKSGYLLRVQESIDLLHAMYERVMSTNVRKI